MSALAIQEKPIQKKFNGNVIELYPNKDHEFVMTTKQVANAYGTDPQVINRHKYRHSDELLENKHFLLECTKCTSENRGAQNLPIRKAYWTKSGVVMLGFFIKSERAKEFRKWAANLILDHMEQKAQKPKRKALGKSLELSTEVINPESPEDLLNEVIEMLKKDASVGILRDVREALRKHRSVKIKPSELYDIDRIEGICRMFSTHLFYGVIYKKVEAVRTSKGYMYDEYTVVESFRRALKEVRLPKSGRPKITY